MRFGLAGRMIKGTQTRQSELSLATAKHAKLECERHHALLHRTRVAKLRQAAVTAVTIVVETCAARARANDHFHCESYDPAAQQTRFSAAMGRS